MNLFDIEKIICDFMSQRGIICKDKIIIDGKLHRFKQEGDKSLNGWYVFYDNNHFVAGKFGCWKRNISETYCSKEIKNLTTIERKEYDVKIEQARKTYEEEQKKRHEAARIKANKLWDSSATSVESSHPYLIKKKIKPYNIRSSTYKNNVNLVIPLSDNSGVIHSLQFIYPSGEKRFLSGGAIKGYYHVLGNPNDSDIIYIGEGYATCASIHEAVNQCVIIAFDSGNLLFVAQNIRRKYPNKKIIICADNDYFREDGNIGVLKAIEAAKSIGEKEISIPHFKDLSAKPTDFNDLHTLEGLEIVVEQIKINRADITTINLEEYTMSKDTKENKQSVNTATTAKDDNNKDKAVPPEGFIVNNDGVFYLPREEGKYLPDNHKVFISSRIDVIARTRDTEGRNHGRLLQFKDSDEKLHSWAMPMSALATDGAECRRSLLNMGVVIDSNKKARDKLTDYLSKSLPQKTFLCVDRTGWQEGCFVFPDEVIGKSKDEKIIFQSMAYNIEGFKKRGTLEEWQENIAKYCVGNSRLILAVCAAFAAPLIKWLEKQGVCKEESGGIHFNGASSTGKTTALKIAASIWGDRKRLHTWRATSNGLEAVAAQHNDSLLCIDEMAQVDPKEAGEIAYMLANETGKNRCKKDGSLQSKSTWQMLFLSSGEVGLTEHIQQTGQRTRAGQQVRFLDIPADAGKGLGIFETLHKFLNGSEFARHLDQQTQIYYGIPIREFLKKLIDKNSSKEELNEKTKKVKEDFIKQLNIGNDVDGQVKRAADRFALLAVAGELATHLGITGWKEGEVIQAIEKCFQNWLNRRGGALSFEEIQATQQVRKFFQIHYPTRFIQIDSIDGTTTKNIQKAGFYERNAGIFYLYVETEVFNDEICKGLNSREVAKFCIKRKWLVPDENGKSSKNHHDPITKKSRRFYWFNDAVLSDEI